MKVSATQDSCETQRAFMVFYKVKKQPASGLIFHADLTTASASRGFDQCLSVQGRKVCNHLDVSSIETQVGWACFCLDSAGVFLGENLSADL